MPTKNRMREATFRIKQGHTQRINRKQHKSDVESDLLAKQKPSDKSHNRIQRSSENHY